MSLSLPRRRRNSLAMDTSLAIVNIVLLLIFFFVIAGQAAVEQTDFNLSETANLPLERLPSPILIVDEDGAWSLDGVPISPELLAGSMAGKGQTLYLMIDSAAPADHLIQVLNRPETHDYTVRLVTIRARGGA